MRKFQTLALMSSFVLSALATACGGGSPCAKAVEATAKFGGAEEKKMATEAKDQFIKVCEMGLSQSPEMAKVVECQAKASDEKAFKDCNTVK